MTFFEIGFTYTDLIIATGDQLELFTHGSVYRKISLNSYNASKLSALEFDAVTRKLFFSDIRHLQSHILGVSLHDESPRLTEEIVESKRTFSLYNVLRNVDLLSFFSPLLIESKDETIESLAYDPVDKMLLWTDGFNRSIRRVKVDNDGINVKEKTSIEIVHLLENDAKPRALVTDPCTRYIQTIYLKFDCFPTD